MSVAVKPSAEVSSVLAVFNFKWYNLFHAYTVVIFLLWGFPQVTREGNYYYNWGICQEKLEYAEK